MAEKLTGTWRILKERTILFFIFKIFTKNRVAKARAAKAPAERGRGAAKGTDTHTHLIISEGPSLNFGLNGGKVAST